MTGGLGDWWTGGLGDCLIIRSAYSVAISGQGSSPNKGSNNTALPLTRKSTMLAKEEFKKSLILVQVNDNCSQLTLRQSTDRELQQSWMVNEVRNYVSQTALRYVLIASRRCFCQGVIALTGLQQEHQQHMTRIRQNRNNNRRNTYEPGVILWIGNTASIRQ